MTGKYFLYDGSLSNQGFSKENVDSLNDRLWYVLPKESGENPKIDTLLENDYILQLNDIVKLGKVKFAVIGLNLPNQCDLTIDSNTTEYMDGDIRHNNFPIFDTNQNNSEIINNSFCVICMSESNYDNNPLLTLCKCKGGMRYTHFICLRKWMETKITKKVNDKNNVFSYHVKSFMCNICKTPYPCKIIF